MLNKSTLFIVIGVVLVGVAVNSSKFNNLLNSLASSSNNSKTVSEPVCREQESLAKVKSCTYLVQTNLGHGSGFYVSGGYIITNRHVIEGANRIFTTKDDEDIPLTLWGHSKDEDLAVLKAPFDALSCNWADSRSIPLAETLYAIGWPFSPEGESSVTRGIHSRSLKAIEGPEFIQTDAAINPGSSGGPLVGQCGIIGINTAKISWSDPNTPTEGFGFAISSNTAKPIVERLIAEGKPINLPVGRIEIREYTPDYSYEYANPQPTPTPKPKPSYNLETEEGRFKFWQDFKNTPNDEFVEGGFDTGAEQNNPAVNITSVEALGGGKVKVSWAPLNQEVLYYQVHYGPNSGGYDFTTSAGNNTSLEVGGFPVGSKYYFTVSAGWHGKNSLGQWEWQDTSRGNEVSVIVK